MSETGNVDGEETTASDPADNNASVSRPWRLLRAKRDRLRSSDDAISSMMAGRGPERYCMAERRSPSVTRRGRLRVTPAPAQKQNGGPTESKNVWS